MSVLAISAIGDALGAPYEFNAVTLERDETPILQRYGGLNQFEAGEWTDDTYMALGISYAAIQEDPLETKGLNKVANNFVVWSREYPAGIGNQTRSVLYVKDNNFTADTLRHRAFKNLQENPNSSAGNGSLMRIHPISLLNYSRKDLAKIAENVTVLTHADPRCVESSILWTELLRVARVTGELSPYSGIDLIGEQSRPYWNDIISESLNTDSREFGIKPWWVVPAFQQALSVVNSNLEAVKTAPMKIFSEIISTPNCDTDTISAIAGGLMGALGTTTEMFDKSVLNKVHGVWPSALNLGNLKNIENLLLSK